MSYVSSDMLVWVSDLDGYVDLDSIDRANEKEAKQTQLDHELSEIGELKLMAGKAISAFKLNNRGISPSEWRHAVHQAETALRPRSVIVRPGRECQSVECQFLRAMLELGRSYAIARYARWEHLDFHSAKVATLPHGIRALINQMLTAEGIERTSAVEVQIRAALGPEAENQLIAYRSTGLLQAALHRIADQAPGHSGSMGLDRKRMRIILSLTRLHFSAAELRLTSVEQLRTLLTAYKAERETVWSDDSRTISHGRLISAWPLRHIRPLLDLYPYAVRNGLKRLLAHLPQDHVSLLGPLHVETWSESARQLLVNELALAHCGILLMRRAGRERTCSK